MTAYRRQLRRDDVAPAAAEGPAAQPAYATVDGLRVLLRIPDVSEAQSDAALGRANFDAESRTNAALAALLQPLTVEGPAADVRTSSDSPGENEIQIAWKAAALAAGHDASSSNSGALASEDTPIAAPTGGFRGWLSAAVARWTEPQSLVTVAAVLCVCSLAVVLLKSRGSKDGRPADHAVAVNAPAEVAPPPIAMGEPAGGMPAPPDDLLSVPADMPEAPPSAASNAPAFVTAPAAENPPTAPDAAPPAAAPTLESTAPAAGPVENAWSNAAPAADPWGVAPPGGPGEANASVQAAVTNPLAGMATHPQYRPQQPNTAWPPQDQVERLPPLAAPPQQSPSDPLPTRSGPDGVLRNQFAPPGPRTRADNAAPPNAYYIARRPSAVANQPAVIPDAVGAPSSGAVEMSAQPPAARITRITPLAETEAGAAP